MSKSQKTLNTANQNFAFKNGLCSNRQVVEYIRHPLGWRNVKEDFKGMSNADDQRKPHREVESEEAS